MCVGPNMKMCPLECSSLQVIGFSNLRVLEFLVYFTKKRLQNGEKCGQTTFSRILDSRLRTHVSRPHFKTSLSVSLQSLKLKATCSPFNKMLLYKNGAFQKNNNKKTVRFQNQNKSLKCCRTKHNILTPTIHLQPGDRFWDRY